MRKSFVLHIDSLSVLDELTLEQKGELFDAIYCYHIGKEKELSPIIKIAFSQFKNQFLRDDEKYKKTCEARKQAGSLGGKQKVANASKCKQKLAKVADSDNKSDSESDSVNNTSGIGFPVEDKNLFVYFHRKALDNEIKRPIEFYEYFKLKTEDKNYKNWKLAANTYIKNYHKYNKNNNQEKIVFKEHVFYWDNKFNCYCKSVGNEIQKWEDLTIEKLYSLLKENKIKLWSNYEA